MATRATTIPLRRSRSRTTGWGEQLLPIAGITLTLVLLASLSIALGRLPDRFGTSRSVSAFEPLRSVTALPPLLPAPSATWPRSARPIGGIVFVRCTNLWTANADGSSARRLLMMPGLASPTVSPDGRSIAFLGTAAEGNQ